MKNTIVICCALILLSCQHKKSIDYAVLSGTIQNTEKTSIYVESKEISLDESGSFTDTIKTNGAAIIYFDGKNFAEVFLEPGSNVSFTYDYNDFAETLNFQGVGSEQCQYLFEKNEFQKSSVEDNKEIYLLEEAAYMAKLKEISSIKEARLLETKNLSLKLKERELRFINYGYLFQLLRYEGNHRYMAKKSDFKVSEAFKATLNEGIENLDFNLGLDFLNSKEYSALITKKLADITRERMKIDSTSWSLTYLKAIGELKNDTIKNGLAFSSARNEIKYSKDLETYYNTFLTISTDERNNEEISGYYNKLKALVEGMPSPKFENYENYKGGTTSIDDFKGKYVFIDIWATWCGPCKAQIPYLEKLIEDYHGKNIAFISISVDKQKDYDAWRNMIKEKDMKGHQLLADNDFNSKFIRDYMINAIPRFMLLDPEGNIVDPTAPQPSDERLIALFQKHGI